MVQSGTTRVIVVAGTRTPFVKAATSLREHSALDLSAHAVRGLLEKHGVDPKLIDELVFGIVIVDPRVPNMAREIVLSTELSSSLPAHTISNNCITGASAVASIYYSIVSGRAEAGIAGGVESMSNPPVLFGESASRIFLDSFSRKSLRATGARIVTTLANEMKRRDARLGLISICGAGGTAIAMLLERDGSPEEGENQ